MTTLTVVDNHNGTVNLSGSAIANVSNGLVYLTIGPGVVDNHDGTLSLSNATGGPNTPVKIVLAPRRTIVQLPIEKRHVRAKLNPRRTKVQLEEQ